MAATGKILLLSLRSDSIEKGAYSSGAVHLMLCMESEHDVYGSSQAGVGPVVSCGASVKHVQKVL